MKKRNFEKDYIKANRKASREEEIKEHGKLISTMPTKVSKSKKAYSRKGKNKVNLLAV